MNLLINNNSFSCDFNNDLNEINLSANDKPKNYIN